jgi:hypothetical protein
MSRILRQRRAAVAAATRRWRRRQTQGIQLVTIEVSEARLAQLMVQGRVPRAALDDPLRLGTALGRLLQEEPQTGKKKGKPTPVMDHVVAQSLAVQGVETGNAITAGSGERSSETWSSDQTEHGPEQGRDRRGRWRKGTSGNPRGRVPNALGDAADDRWLAQLLERLERSAAQPGRRGDAPSRPGAGRNR